MPSRIFGRKEKIATLDEVAPVITMSSLEQEFDALQAELLLQQSKLDHLNAAFHERELRSTPLREYQELSAEISKQQTIVSRLREQFQQKELELGEKRRLDASRYEARQRAEGRQTLNQEISAKTERIDKATDMIQRLRQQIEVLVSERDILLQELARLGQQENDGVN